MSAYLKSEESDTFYSASSFWVDLIPTIPSLQSTHVGLYARMAARAYAQEYQESEKLR